MRKIQIERKGITVQIGDKTFALSDEEARALYYQLQNALNMRTPDQYRPYITPWSGWSQPTDSRGPCTLTSCV